MSKTDLTMKIKDAFGKSSTSKISYVNSDATNSQLAAFAGKLNAMTTNTLEEASRVSTTELSLTPKTQRRLAPDVNISDTVTLSTIQSATSAGSAWAPTLTVYDSENQVIENLDAYEGMYVKNYTCCLPACIRVDPNNSYPDLYISYQGDWHFGSKTGTITVALPENDTYAYTECVITVTEG